MRVVVPRFPCLGCGSGGPHPSHISLARCRFIGQAASRQPGPCPAARLSALNRGKGEGFPPILSHFFNHYYFSFLLFAKYVRVSWRVLQEGRVERGREKTHRFVRKSEVQCGTRGLPPWTRRCWLPSPRRGYSCRRR